MTNPEFVNEQETKEQVAEATRVLALRVRSSMTKG